MPHLAILNFVEQISQVVESHMDMDIFFFDREAYIGTALPRPLGAVLGLHYFTNKSSLWDYICSCLSNISPLLVSVNLRFPVSFRVPPLTMPSSHISTWSQLGFSEANQKAFLDFFFHKTGRRAPLSTSRRCWLTAAFISLGTHLQRF